MEPETRSAGPKRPNLLTFAVLSVATFFALSLIVHLLLRHPFTGAYVIEQLISAVVYGVIVTAMMTVYLRRRR